MCTEQVGVSRLPRPARAVTLSVRVGLEPTSRSGGQHSIDRATDLPSLDLQGLKVISQSKRKLFYGPQAEHETTDRLWAFTM